ncbi:hypothetical protein SY83_00160 [Paenibacillus swuensis]|uniref:GH18 domain-containing protein n=1 Tax=Paenibacillus swuensis TaxID=1178515 RepID=A0A172TDM6_9BACL|nr:stalk domain-containing protein [Paenibacillus swuensis]ANE45052.1 hypothetical protein SY83_00160 [Paenibacillus swuensis]
MIYNLYSSRILRKVSSVLTSSLLLGTVLAPSAILARTSSSEIGITLDDYALPFPVAPFFGQGVTMVPFRSIAEALDIRVRWDAAAKSIIADGTDSGGSKQVILTLNKKTAKVNGQSVSLSAAPVQIKGNVLVPLNFFSSQFGASVAWNGAMKKVEILSPKEKMHLRAFYAIKSFSHVSLIPDFDSVAFGWARLNEQGEFITNGKDFYLPQAAGDVTPESIVGDAVSSGTAPYLMVYSGDEQGQLTKLLGDEDLMDRALDGLFDLAETKGFQGVMLDFEGLGLIGPKGAGVAGVAKVQIQFTEFVHKASSRARAQGLKLSVALQPLNGWFKGYDYKKLGALVDDMVIMAYAYGDQQSPEPLPQVDEAIRLSLAQVPKEKLLLGVSFASENEASLNAVVGLAKRYNLKGAAFWRLGQPGAAELGALFERVERNQSK